MTQKVLNSLITPDYPDMLPKFIQRKFNGEVTADTKSEEAIIRTSEGEVRISKDEITDVIIFLQSAREALEK